MAEEKSMAFSLGAVKARQPSLTVPPHELEAAYAGAAPLTNRFVVTMSAAGVRIAFLEEDGTGGPLHFRTASLLSFADAIALKNLLGTMLAQVEEQLAKVQVTFNG
ncbi:MAG: hypothetical protein ACKVP5_03745 [Aestuariivirga sp.]